MHFFKSFELVLISLRLLIIGTIMIFPAAVLSQEAPLLTVSDSVEMSKFVPIGGRGKFVLESPDQTGFVIVVHRGNIEKNANVYELRYYLYADISRHAESNAVSNKTLAVFTSYSNNPGIDVVRWLDNDKIAFLGETVTGPQVFTVVVSSNAMEQITKQNAGVLDYSFDENRDTVVFAMAAPHRQEQYLNEGYLVGTDVVHSVAFPGSDRNPFFRTDYFSQVVSGKVTRIFRTSEEERGSRGIWVSPDGRNVVFTTYNPDHDPDWWSNYEPASQSSYRPLYEGNTNRSFLGAFTGVMRQFILVNLSTLESRFLLDAPTGDGFRSGNVGAAWSPDGNRLALTNTFVDRSQVDDEDAVNVRFQTAVVEFDVLDRRANIVDWLQNPEENSSPSSCLVDGAVYDDVSTIRIEYSCGDLAPTKRFVHVSGDWRIDPAFVPVINDSSRTIVNVAQDLNTPPELAVRGADDNRFRTITNFNQKLRRKNLGRIEPIKWTDATGREWEAGLIRPINYQPGHRYPLVIQTHGFDRDKFWIDGPYGSASGYAGRVLAAHGIAVVQLEDKVGPRSVPEEIETQLNGYASLVAHLDQSGIIDPKRVGIHVWSRTGYYLLPALLDERLNFLAASAADADILSKRHYTDFFGIPVYGMLDVEGLIGTPLWDEEGRQTWSERDLTNHLDEVDTPLRIETTAWIPAWWDAYAILRRHNKPVDYFFFPTGAHSLVKPLERRTSQQGTVDWYRFWLTGKENADPTRSEQYVRWRAMRDAQSQSAQSNLLIVPEHSSGDSK